jgi:hypothetical protein
MREKLGRLLDRAGGALKGRLHPGLERSLTLLEFEARMATAFSRAAATAATRVIDSRDPISWEFSGFSQHGEDGIIDYLCSRLKERHRFFFEIGSADGLENCTAWLAFARGYGGVMVEGDPNLSARCRRMLEGRVWNIEAVNLMVNTDSISSLMKMCPHRDPDVFVIDIDGIDYHVAREILAMGYRPKIFVVEYNSSFGPERSVTVPYEPMFSRWEAHPTGLFYGASVSAWRALLGRHGYSFATVDSSGVNAFFLDPACFPEGFAAAVRGPAFRDNLGDLNEATRPYRDDCGDLVLPGRDWRSQFERIADAPFVEV